MELTIHGSERIHGRTKMHRDDVLSIIAGKAVVDLGVANGGRYLLFYSPPDGRARIVVVSENGTCIITVLERNHVPKGVKEASRKRELKARDLLRNFVQARIKAKNQQGSGTA